MRSWCDAGARGKRQHAAARGSTRQRAAMRSNMRQHTAGSGNKRQQAAASGNKRRGAARSGNKRQETVKSSSERQQPAASDNGRTWSVAGILHVSPPDMSCGCCWSSAAGGCAARPPSCGMPPLPFPPSLLSLFPVSSLAVPPDPKGVNPLALYLQEPARFAQCDLYTNARAIGKRPHRLVVRTSRCGRDNPGSTPGVDMSPGQWLLTCRKPPAILVHKAAANCKDAVRRRTKVSCPSPRPPPPLRSVGVVRGSLSDAACPTWDGSRAGTARPGALRPAAACRPPPAARAPPASFFPPLLTRFISPLAPDSLLLLAAHLPTPAPCHCFTGRVWGGAGLGRGGIVGSRRRPPPDRVRRSGLTRRPKRSDKMSDAIFVLQAKSRQDSLAEWSKALA